MTYLTRVARRAEAPATRVQPAMPSRSPLAEADQRLNLDAFAAHFDATFVKPRVSFAPDIEAPAADSARRAGMQPKATPAPQTDSRTPARVEFSPGPSTWTIPLASESAKPMESTSIAPRSESVESGDEKPQGSFVHKSSTRTVNALPQPEIAAVQLPIPVVEQRESSLSAGDSLRERVVQEGVSDAIVHALHEAMSWVEGGGRQGSKSERGTGEPGHPSIDSAQAMQPLIGLATRALPTRRILSETQPVTHLEIGKIEVEVVPSVKPVRNAAQPRPRPRTASFSGASAQTFGWRQR